MKGINKRLREELASIAKRGLERSLRPPVGIDLSSNDYLGLAEDERLKSAVIEAVRREGVGSTGSRLLRGDRESFASVERMFAEWKGSEASLYFATGYQANIGIFQAFLEAGDIVFSDQLNHASIIDGIRLGKADKCVYPHLDLDALERALRDRKTDGERFVVTESLFSMDGDIAPLDRIAEICGRHGANLIVDEAHAVGVYGETGSGLIERFGIQDDVFLSLNTAGKALGVGGAFVAGSRQAIAYLVNRCRPFIFSTAPLPAAAAAISTSVEIVRNDRQLRERLLRISELFAELLKDRGLGITDHPTHIVPVVIGESSRAVEAAGLLQQQGFDVRAIRPPTVPEGTSRLRVSLNTKLSEEELVDIAAKLATAVKGKAVSKP